MFRHPCGAPSLNPVLTSAQISKHSPRTVQSIVVVAWQFPYLCIESNTVLFPAGNKSDHTNREITQEQGRQFAQENDMPFLETSANNSNNIDKLFLQLAKMLLEHTLTRTQGHVKGVPVVVALYLCHVQLQYKAAVVEESHLLH